MKNIIRYPNVRLRRNRKTDWSRRLVRENNLSTNDLIWPIFIREGKNIKEPISTMPGVFRYTLDKLEDLVEKAINKVLEDGLRTADIMQPGKELISTEKMGEEICNRLDKLAV